MSSEHETDTERIEREAVEKSKKRLSDFQATDGTPEELKSELPYTPEMRDELLHALDKSIENNETLETVFDIALNIFLKHAAGI